MVTPDDFKELLKCFNTHGVDYVVIGAFALAHHGAPRLTGDMDLLVRPDSQNARKILDALRDFGMGSLDLNPEDLDKPGKVVQLGVPPVRIDLITSIEPLSWETVWASKSRGTLAGIPVWYIGLTEFIANKRSAGRKRDLADLESLGQDA